MQPMPMPAMPALPNLVRTLKNNLIFLQQFHSTVLGGCASHVTTDANHAITTEEDAADANKVNKAESNTIPYNVYINFEK
jgi:hypothetical protein